MINDDKNKPDEFEDFDFDNFDDLDNEALDNESLDDDLIIEAESIDDELQAEELADFDDTENWDSNDSNETAPLTQKSSKNKLIIPAAIGMIALAGASYFVLSSPTPATNYSGLESDNQSESSFPSDNQLVEENDIPMPSPISAPETNGAELDTESQASLDNENVPDPYAPQTVSDEQAAEVLTPMPNAASLNETDNTQSNDQMAELDLDIPQSEQDPALTDSALSGNSDITDPLSFDNNNAQVPMVDTVDNTSHAPVSEITESDASDPFINTPQDNMDAQISATNSPAEIVGDVPTQEIVPAVSNEEIQALESKLSELEQSVSSKDQTIDELNKQIALLEQSLQTTENDLQSLKARESADSASTESQSPVSAPTPLIELPAENIEPAPAVAAQPAPVVKAETPRSAPLPEIAPKWELRSAQPGKAYVGIVGSKEVLVVQVGDTLQGVGRITSIAKNGERWIVSGTNGEIVR